LSGSIKVKRKQAWWWWGHTEVKRVFFKNVLYHRNRSGVSKVFHAVKISKPFLVTKRNGIRASVLTASLICRCFYRLADPSVSVSVSVSEPLDKFCISTGVAFGPATANMHKNGKREK